MISAFKGSVSITNDRSNTRTRDLYRAIDSLPFNYGNQGNFIIMHYCYYEVGLFINSVVLPH